MNTNARIIFMFSGQGSQYYQMGKELQNHPIFSYWMKEGAAILDRLGQPGFLMTLYENPMAKSWNNILQTHPGLVIIEYAVAQLLKNLGVVPDAVLGFSVGEFAAAAVAGVWTLEDAVKAAYKQAKLIEEFCPKGGMTAVLAPPDIYWQAQFPKQGVHFAGINYSEHFLIAGGSEVLNRIQQALRYLNKNFVLLPIDYAFHSKEIEAAEMPFKDYCKKHLQLKDPQICMISGLTGLPIPKVSYSYFWDVVNQPLYFQRVITLLELHTKTFYIDLGPSGTLATFVKYNLDPTSQSRGVSLLTPFHNGEKNIEKLLLYLNG